MEVQRQQDETQYADDGEEGAMEVCFVRKDGSECSFGGWRHIYIYILVYQRPARGLRVEIPSFV